MRLLTASLSVETNVLVIFENEDWAWDGRTQFSGFGDGCGGKTSSLGH